MALELNTYSVMIPLKSNSRFLEILDSLKTNSENRILSIDGTGTIVSYTLYLSKEDLTVLKLSLENVSINIA